MSLFDGVQDVAGPGDAGAVDQDVDFEIPDGGSQRGGVGQVDDVRDGAGLVGEVFQAFLVAGDGVDCESALGQAFGDGGAHSGGGAGDEGC